jgi:hypothetical protein
MRKKQNGEFLPWSSKKIKKVPVLKSPTQTGFISVIKIGPKSPTWAPLKTKQKTMNNDKTKQFMANGHTGT